MFFELDSGVPLIGSNIESYANELSFYTPIDINSLSGTESDCLEDEVCKTWHFMLTKQTKCNTWFGQSSLTFDFVTDVFAARFTKNYIRVGYCFYACTSAYITRNTISALNLVAAIPKWTVPRQALGLKSTAKLFVTYSLYFYNCQETTLEQKHFSIISVNSAFQKYSKGDLFLWWV